MALIGTDGPKNRKRKGRGTFVAISPKAGAEGDPTVDADREITYIYDGNNRRVSRTKGGVTTYYVHAANGDLILEYTPSTQTGLQHIYVNGKRIATKRVTM